MTDTDNFGLDTFASRAIYKDFIGGKIINADEYIDGELQPSRKFRNLVDNIDRYRAFYSLIGFEIRPVGESGFFVSRCDRAEELNEVAANIQVLLLVIGRGLCAQGISPAILFDARGGISTRDTDAIGCQEEVSQIMKACGLSQPLTKPVNSIMVERGIFHKTVQERYILSSAGRIFFNELFSDTTTPSGCPGHQPPIDAGQKTVGYSPFFLREVRTRKHQNC